MYVYIYIYMCIYIYKHIHTCACFVIRLQSLNTLAESRLLHMSKSSFVPTGRGRNSSLNYNETRASRDHLFRVIITQ